MAAIEVKDIGPITRLTLDIPEKGGIVVLKGRNGRGKSLALEGIDRLTGGKGRVDKRDGTLSGTIAGLGVTLNVVRSATRSGELEVDSLGDRLSVDDLVVPPIKDPTAADSRRIKALVRLAGVEADVSRFRGLFASAEEYADLVSSDAAATDDMVTMAAKIKRDCDAAARSAEKDATKAEAAAETRKAMCEGVDLDANVDAAAAREEHLDAATECSRLKERNHNALLAAEEKTKSRVKLEQAEMAYEGPTVVAANDAVGVAAGCVEQATERTASLERQLEQARRIKASAISAEEQAKAALKRAQDHERRIADWRTTVESDTIEPPSNEEILTAGQRLDAAESAVGELPALEAARRHFEESLALAQAAKDAREKAVRLREMGRGTDNVLSEIIGKLNTPLRVEGGRLVTTTTRGATLFADLSMGERWMLGLDIAVSVCGRRSIFTVHQEAWESLDPPNRMLVARKCIRHCVVIITAEATADEELVAVAFEPAAA